MTSVSTTVDVVDVARNPAPLDDRPVLVLPDHGVLDLDSVVVDLEHVVVGVEERVLHLPVVVELDAVGLPVPAADLLVVRHVHPEVLHADLLTGRAVSVGDEGVVRRLVDGDTVDIEGLAGVGGLELQHLHAGDVAVLVDVVLVAVGGVGLVHVLLAGQHAETGHLVGALGVVGEPEGTLDVGSGGQVDPLDVRRQDGVVVRTHVVRAGTEVDDLLADGVEVVHQTGPRPVDRTGLGGGDQLLGLLRGRLRVGEDHHRVLWLGADGPVAGLLGGEGAAAALEVVVGGDLLGVELDGEPVAVLAVGNLHRDGRAVDQALLQPSAVGRTVT